MIMRQTLYPVILLLLSLAVSGSTAAPTPAIGTHPAVSNRPDAQIGVPAAIGTPSRKEAQIGVPAGGRIQFPERDDDGADVRGLLYYADDDSLTNGDNSDYDEDDAEVIDLLLIANKSASSPGGGKNVAGVSLLVDKNFSSANHSARIVNVDLPPQQLISDVDQLIAQAGGHVSLLDLLAAKSAAHNNPGGQDALAISEPPPSKTTTAAAAVATAARGATTVIKENLSKGDKVTTDPPNITPAFVTPETGRPVPVDPKATEATIILYPCRTVSCRLEDDKGVECCIIEVS